MRSIHRIAILIGFAAGLNAFAADTATRLPAPGEVQLKAEIKAEEIPGLATIRRASVKVGTNSFSFILPWNYVYKSSGAEGVTLTRADDAVMLTCRPLVGVVLGDAEAAQRFCRGMVKDQFPQAPIKGEFTGRGVNLSGPAFDLEGQTTGGAASQARVIFLQCDTGLVEFTALCSPANFKAASHDLNALVLTFRASDKSGKIEPTEISNRL